MGVPEEMHPAVRAILRFFEYEHLPEPQQTISRQFSALAWEMVQSLGATPHGAELTVGLRKLLEAKDCCVRASLS